MSMDATFFVKELLVAKISKEDCIGVQDAARELGISRGTIYTYMNILRLQKHRFPFDRTSYILRSDLEKIRLFKDTREIS